MKVHSRLSSVLPVVLFSFFAANSYAAVLEEIIVTAQKREQNLQNVGISVTALSGDQMRKFEFNNSTEVGQQIPGVTNFSTMGRGAAAFTYIRGIGQNDFGDAHESPVVGYNDEFYLLPQTAIDFGLFDLERVEVLRGPQGTLFGRNTTGGLMHYVTNKPGDLFNGYIDATYASYDEVIVEAAAGGPLSEDLSVRVAGLFHEADGYIKNRGPFPDGSDVGTYAARGQFTYEPTETFRVTGKVQYGERDVIPLYTDHEIVSFDPATGLASNNPGGVDIFGYSESQLGVEEPREVWTDSPQDLESEAFHTLLRAEWDIGEVTLTSLTGYLNLSRDNIEDCDGSINFLCIAAFPFDTEHVTQELRVAGETGQFRWTTGLYYLYQDADAKPYAELVTGIVVFDAPWTLETESISVFGQAEYSLHEDWTLIGGVRYTHDEKNFETENRTSGVFVTPAANFTREAVGGLTNRKEDLISAKLELDWHPTEDLLVYGSVSRGTKAGGFNNGFYSIPTPEQVPYGDETLYAFEIGMKNTFLDGRARLNAAAFYYDYSDFHTYNWNGLGGAISNSDASSYGAEVEFAITPADRLNISVGVALLDSEIEDVTNGTVVRDVEMSFAPAFDITGQVIYSWPVWNGDLEAQWNFNYMDNRYNNNYNDPASDLEESFVTNARLSWLSANQDWEVSFFVKNLTDETNLIKIFVFPFNYRQAVYDPPRWFGGSIRRNFN
ncbi:MAG: TonB-dependent receptor [Gammaproteobacteria bacterium]|nr:TonB-dependent receptor [Gammaproteobacteria bacterium]